MFINLECTINFDPITNQTSLVSARVLPNDETFENDENSIEPKIVLDSNKYQLNKQAIILLGACPGTRIDIRYKQENNELFPLIGLSESFGSVSGNKVSKAYTISCRGTARELLARFGTVFTLIPYKDGLYKLIGNDSEKVQESLKKVDNIVFGTSSKIITEEEKNDALIVSNSQILESITINDEKPVDNSIRTDDLDFSFTLKDETASTEINKNIFNF